MSTSDDAARFPARSGPWRRIDQLALFALISSGIVLRFWTRSPMWLDEALTAHIAGLPAGQIAGALRHDGHPPLYYFLLHVWMKAFGTSDLAIRSLAGVFGVLLLPLMWVAGRRLGGRTVAWSGVVLVVWLPYALRYSTENRMYSLVMVLALGAWLLADRALDHPRPLNLVGLTLCTSALLWTHYWALWLGIAASLCLITRVVRRRRAGAPDDVRSTLWVLAAMATGAATFIPWIPTLLYQSVHTGTPWGSRSFPTAVIVSSVGDLGGGQRSDQVMCGMVITLVILIGLFAAAVDSRHLSVDLRTQVVARRPMIVAVLTLSVAVTAMMATNAAFQTRYNAVWLPFALLVGALGLATFRGPWVTRGVLVVVVTFSATGAVRNVITRRTQARDAAAVIVGHGRPGDVVGICPDQLGPSLMRELPSGFVVGSFPTFSDPHTVDWVNYVRRTHSATPQQFAQQLLALAKPTNRRIFLVWSGSYRTHTGMCEQVVNALQAARPTTGSTLLTPLPELVESENVFEFGPPVRQQ